MVADEVQGLAERAAASTRQIENLVKTIQSDTNEAVASMEQTTAEVVRGAQLANNAGNALNDIQTTSENLATLILAIAKETQNQSQSAESIVGSMRVIQDISAQTLEGTTESARAVGELSEQADELRQSIADFKLPDAMQPESIAESTGRDLAMGVDEMSFVDVDEDHLADDMQSMEDYDNEILGPDAEVEETTSFEADSGADSDDDADLDVEFADDLDVDINETESTQAIEQNPDEESLDNVDFADFEDGTVELEATSHDAEAADVTEDELTEESVEAEDFEATMIMEAADLEIDDNQTVEEEMADEDENDEDTEFSFDDEDFLSFDLDEEEKKK